MIRRGAQRMTVSRKLARDEITDYPLGSSNRSGRIPVEQAELLLRIRRHVGHLYDAARRAADRASQSGASRGP